MDRVRRMAKVYYGERLAGVLSEIEQGFRFEYDPDYLVGGAPLSFTLPLREAPFESAGLPGFFDNLVAEGWLRTLQSQEQRIDEDDHFGLLLANGRDLVGAVTIIESI